MEPIKDNPSSLRAHGPSCSPIFGAYYILELDLESIKNFKMKN